MAMMSAISSIDQHTKLIAFLVNKHRGRLDCMGLNSCLTIMHKCNARGDQRRPGPWFLQLDVRLPCACIHLRTLQSTDLDTAVRCRGSLFHWRRRLYVWEPEAVQHSRPWFSSPNSPLNFTIKKKISCHIKMSANA
jgi:hypothetical protein